jgi:membrane-bound serine protease (ClpP class)
MFLVLALLALVFLPSPWNIVGAIASASLAVLEVGYFHRRLRGAKVQTGVENLLGATGKVTDGLAPSGHIRVLGELWEAHANSDLPAGSSVRVVAVNGLTLEVEALEETPTGASGAH